MPSAVPKATTCQLRHRAADGTSDNVRTPSFREAGDMRSKLIVVGFALEMEAEAKGEMFCALATLLGYLIEEIGKLSSRIEHVVAQLRTDKSLCLFHVKVAFALLKSWPSSVTFGNASPRKSNSPLKPVSLR